MSQDVLRKAEDKMKKSVEAFERDLAGMRTGRASAGLVDGIMVDYYGTMTPMKQLGTINTPEARLITIQVWDKGAVSAVEKAIQKANIGLTPNIDGMTIRLAVPPLTEERRKEIVKMVHRRLEEAKIAVRNVRRDAIEELRALEKDKRISQDDQKRAEAQLQKHTDTSTDKAQKASDAKEAEVLRV
ncbi:MAG: ribosome recycling factor [Chloroflexi bacterium]|nr:ribosome recycling factor [Chloroflexota bacterium]